MYKSLKAHKDQAEGLRKLAAEINAQENSQAIKKNKKSNNKNNQASGLLQLLKEISQELKEEELLAKTLYKLLKEGKKIKKNILIIDDNADIRIITKEGEIEFDQATKFLIYKKIIKENFKIPKPSKLYKLLKDEIRIEKNDILTIDKSANIKLLARKKGIEEKEIEQATKFLIYKKIIKENFKIPNALQQGVYSINLRKISLRGKKSLIVTFSPYFDITIAIDKLNQD